MLYLFRSYKKCVLYGGCTNTYEKVSSKFYIYNYEASNWCCSDKEINPTLWGHSANFIDDKLLIFGGMNYYGDECNTIYSYNFVKNKLGKLSNKMMIAPRRRHCTDIFDKNLYIFGGFNNSDYYNDLYCLTKDDDIIQIANQSMIEEFAKKDEVDIDINDEERNIIIENGITKKYMKSIPDEEYNKLELGNIVPKIRKCKTGIILIYSFLCKTIISKEICRILSLC